MTNLPQGPGSFIAAMECVLQGGKAWRESWVSSVKDVKPWLYADPIGGFIRFTVFKNSPSPTAEFTRGDLTATDWVCEPKEGG